MNEIYKPEFGKRFDIFLESEQMKIFQNLQALKASFYIFDRNYHELINWIEDLEDTKDSLRRYNSDQRDNLQLVIQETSRLFHNFLASTESLVGHTRVIVKNIYSNHEFQYEYQTKVDLLKNNSLHFFVKRLRNYTLHYTLPILGLEINFTSNISFRLQIDVKALKKWDDWGSAKSYLEKLGDSLCLKDLVKEYFILINDFNEWLYEKQQSIHKADLEKFEELQKDLLT